MICTPRLCVSCFRVIPAFVVIWKSLSFFISSSLCFTRNSLLSAPSRSTQSVLGGGEGASYGVWSCRRCVSTPPLRPIDNRRSTRACKTRNKRKVPRWIAPAGGGRILIILMQTNLGRHLYPDWHSRLELHFSTSTSQVPPPTPMTCRLQPPSIPAHPPKSPSSAVHQLGSHVAEGAGDVSCHVERYHPPNQTMVCATYQSHTAPVLWVPPDGGMRAAMISFRPDVCLYG